MAEKNLRYAKNFEKEAFLVFLGQTTPESSPHLFWWQKIIYSNFRIVFVFVHEIHSDKVPIRVKTFHNFELSETQGTKGVYWWSLQEKDLPVN